LTGLVQSYLAGAAYPLSNRPLAVATLAWHACSRFSVLLLVLIGALSRRLHLDGG
jgi:hypothetical protein